MLTVRPLPAAASDHPDPLLRLYYGELLRRWNGTRRMVARGIDRLLAGSAACARRRHLGIEPREWRLIDGHVAAEGYVTMRVRKGIHRLINAGGFPLAASPLKNKRLFATLTMGAGLPVPAGYEVGRPAAAWLGDRDRVIVKPNFSSKGADVRRFIRSGPGWRSDDGRTIDRAAMAATIETAARRGGIVQEAVRTAAALADLSPGALPTARIVTMRDEAGHPEIVARTLRLGGGTAPVDNFNRGGLAAEVAGNGRIGAFMRHGPDGRLVTETRHPHHDAPLPDRLCRDQLARCDRLALDAHRLLVPDHGVVGWDVGLGEGGPVLIEGNWNPGTDLPQLLTGQPLSAGRTGALYAHALKVRTEADWRRASPVQHDRG